MPFTEPGDIVLRPQFNKLAPRLPFWGLTVESNVTKRSGFRWREPGLKLGSAACWLCGSDKPLNFSKPQPLHLSEGMTTFPPFEGAVMTRL